MPLPEPLPVVQNGTTGTLNFNLFKPLKDGSGNSRLAVGFSANLPYLIDVKHQEQRNAQLAEIDDRHTLTVIKAIMCSDGKMRRVVHNSSILVPRDAAFSDTVLKDVLGCSGNIWYSDTQRVAVIAGFS